MQRDFIKSLIKLFKQADTKNTYLVFQKNGEWFSAEMSEKYIKIHKRHYIIMLIIVSSIIKIIFDEVSIYLHIVLYSCGAALVFSIGNIFRMFIDYFYCRKKFKQGLAKPYIEEKLNELEDEKQADASFCKHQPSIRFRHILNGAWTKREATVCKKCGCSIKESDKIGYSIKSEILGSLMILAALEFLIFLSIQSFKGIKYALQFLTNCTEIFIFDEYSFFNILSGFLVGVCLYFLLCIYLYFQLNYFTEFKKSKPVEGVSSDADRSLV